LQKIGCARQIESELSLRSLALLLQKYDIRFVPAIAKNSDFCFQEK
jgi:hypothetical protein